MERKTEMEKLKSDLLDLALKLEYWSEHSWKFYRQSLIGTLRKMAEQTIEKTGVSPCTTKNPL